MDPSKVETPSTAAEVGHRRRPVHTVLGVFLALIFVAVEMLILVSYRQASATGKRLETATDTATNLANLQRESLLLQGIVLQKARPQQSDETTLRRAFLQRQLEVLLKTVDPEELEPDITAFRNALLRFDRGIQTLREEFHPTAQAVEETLLPPLRDLETFAKRLFDREEQRLYGAIADDLSQAERGQLLLAGLSIIVLILGIALALFLRRSVRRDFARAHDALVTEMREREILQKQLAHQAYHDSLTGLANRALFMREIERSLARAERNGQSAALIYLDLDDFKNVNDTLGHAAGDELLRGVASRLEKCIRKTDTAARLGGDEFAVLIENGGQAGDVVTVVERIVEALRQPFEVAGQHHTTMASIGVVPDADPSTDVDELVSMADTAMYDAKTSGKGVYVVFDESMRIKAGRRSSMERDLERAIENEEFVCFYQPIVNLSEQRLEGMEALVRWRHPSGEILPPSHFLQTAEETGLIREIGRLVLRQAAGTMADWHRRLPQARKVFVSVNVSAQQVQDPSFPGIVAETLRETGLSPRSLVIEITESTMMKDREDAARALGELRDLGVRVAIDDFGTGYSSLSYLRFLPIDILKIDRSFISALAEDSAIPSAIASLASTLGIVSLAEGIERTEQWQRLEEMGCSLGQGFLIAKPEPADEAWSRLEAAATKGELFAEEVKGVHAST